MPHPSVSALFTKPVLARACAAVLVTGAVGVAYQNFPRSPEGSSIETVSVPYAERESNVLAFDDEGEPTPIELDETEEEKPATPPTTVAKVPKTDVTTDDASTETTTTSITDKPKDDVVEDKEDHEEPVVDKIAPKIEILHPADGSHTDTKVVVFEGTTEPGAKVHAGKYSASVDAKGNWRIELFLSPGANAAVITATDAAGNVGHDKVTVWLDVKEEDPKEPIETEKPLEEEPKDPKPVDDETEEVKEIAFDANQKYGSCDAETPYEKFWGTATPNSFVNVTSPYGSGVTEVNKMGQWEIKVFFPDAPRNKPFVIKVTGANGTESFDYVAKPPYEEPEKTEAPAEPKGDVERREAS